MIRTPSALVWLSVACWSSTDPTQAAGTFSDGPADRSRVAVASRLSFDATSGQVLLRLGAGALADSQTLLLTQLDSPADISSPSLSVGGGTAKGVTFTTGRGGHTGEAAKISGRRSLIAFPAAGHFDARQGTVDFWLALPNWGRDPKGDRAAKRTILYAAEGRQRFMVQRGGDGMVRMQFRDRGGGVHGPNLQTEAFQPGSWHHFTFAWNIAEDAFYIAAWLDGAFQGELADPSPNTFDPLPLRSFQPRTLFVGNDVDGATPLGGAIDELRISGAEYAAEDYPCRAGLLTSTAFDTGVPSPVWGDIGWQAEVPDRTAVELQTSASDDGETWTGWMADDEAMFSVTFDDGWSSVYSAAFPTMGRMGLPGTAYVVTRWIGTPRHMTLAQLKELQAAGWEIGSHGAEHNYTQPSMAESKAWLVRNGFGNTTFAYPGGVIDQAAVRRAAEYYTTARTIVNLQQTYDTKYRLYSYAGNSPPEDLATWVDAVVRDKAWGILTFHSVNQDDAPGNVSSEDFRAKMRHLVEAKVDVVTVEKGVSRLGMYRNPAGSPLVTAHKRYIRYRAILHSFDGTSAPALTRVTLSAPRKLYLGIATTIGADGAYEHATWPQTTDPTFDELTIVPAAGSLTAKLERLERRPTYHALWTETRSGPDVATRHVVEHLVAGGSYQIKKDGGAATVSTADSTGRLEFSDTGGPSPTTFEIEGPGVAPAVEESAMPAPTTESAPVVGTAPPEPQWPEPQRPTPGLRKTWRVRWDIILPCGILLIGGILIVVVPRSRAKKAARSWRPRGKSR